MNNNLSTLQNVNEMTLEQIDNELQAGIWQATLSAPAPAVQARLEALEKESKARQNKRWNA